MTGIFKTPDAKEFEQVKQMVEDFWLDNENMQPAQFHVLSENGNVRAFGRLREHADATELCSIGVAKDFRENGLGKKMVEYLISQSKQDIYLVTVIPDLFAKCGFTIVSEYPKSLARKVEICTKEYHVDDPYFVMRWEKKQN